VDAGELDALSEIDGGFMSLWPQIVRSDGRCLSEEHGR
jgi:hypothetical protein